jgi:hypothetical protein
MTNRRIDRREVVGVAGAGILGALLTGCSRSIPSSTLEGDQRTPEEAKMGEQEWLACTDPQKMLDFLLGQVSDRKLRLFAVACCRSVWHLLNGPSARNGVEVAERFADGAASLQEMAAAGDAAGDAPWPAIRAGNPYAECVAHAAIWATATDATTAAHVASRFARGCDQDKKRPDGTAIATHPEEERRQTHLLRDIVGNPFRSVRINPAWRSAEVLALAQGIYDERAFAKMPELATELEKVDCSDAVLLTHCRDRGPHARGCWVLDLLLGKK